VLAVEELVTRFGLIAVFVLTAIEGDLALILGGVAAHLGLMHPFAVGVAGALGGFAGDAAWFALGRRKADAFRRSALYRRVGPTIERLVGRFGPGQILLARPVYGTRVASMLFWGTQRLAPARFAALDLPACALWAVLLVSLGYLSSSGVAALLGEVRRVEEWLAGAAAAAVGVALALGWLMRRRRERAGS
jgi:membrane protein DedA with SNARE-associated domain